MIKRTSSKAFFISVLLLFVCLLAVGAAELYYKSSPIKYSGGVRPWNHWDYVAVPAMVFSAAFAIVGFIFLRKDE